MMTWDFAGELVAVFFGSLFLSAALLPVGMFALRRLGMVDRPNARSGHMGTVLRGTGAVLVITFLGVILGASAIFGIEPLQYGSGTEALVWAVVFLAVVGFVDDRYGVPAFVKLLVQVGSASMIVLAGVAFPLPEWLGSVRGFAEQVFTAVWIVGVINAVNFIDGSDGLATMVSALCMLAFVAVGGCASAALGEQGAGLELSRSIQILGLAGAASSVVFLSQNVSPARCFLGDTGSTFLGLILGVLGVLTAQLCGIAVGSSPAVAYGCWAAPWIVLLVPIGDGLRVVLARVLRGKSPFQPDTTHLHHLLHRAGLSSNQIVVFVGLAVGACGLFATSLVAARGSAYLAVGALAALAVGAFWFLKCSYPSRKFIATALNQRLLHFMDVREGYEDSATFQERFHQELSRVRRYNGCVTAVIVNTACVPMNGNGRAPNPLDNPKFLDYLLRMLRREDVKCRFSDDRLAFLLIETDGEVAKHVCRRLRRPFESIANGESSGLRVGIGAASYPEDGGSVALLLEKAHARALQDLAAGCAGVAVPAGGNGTDSGNGDGNLLSSAGESERTSKSSETGSRAARRLGRFRRRAPFPPGWKT